MIKYVLLCQRIFAPELQKLPKTTSNPNFPQKNNGGKNKHPPKTDKVCPLLIHTISEDTQQSGYASTCMQVILLTSEITTMSD